MKTLASSARCNTEDIHQSLYWFISRMQKSESIPNTTSSALPLRQPVSLVGGIGSIVHMVYPKGAATNNWREIGKDEDCLNTQSRNVRTREEMRLGHLELSQPW